MDSKKILIISRGFFPTNSARSIRATELAKEFSRQGHSVTVLTARMGEVHDRFESEHGLTIEDFGQQTFKRLKVKGSGVVRLFRRAVVRFSELLFEYPDIELTWQVRKALKRQTGYDLMISVAVPYPVHWGVAWARSKESPIADVWVADCGDPYYGLESDTYRKPFYFKYVERWFGRKADYISVPLEKAKSAYFPEFHPKMRVIPQGLSVPKVTGSSAPEKTKIPTFAYIGNIRSYLHYAVPFLKKLNQIEEEFRFIVYTKSGELFSENLDEKTLKKCDIREYADRNTLFQELSAADFLLHFPYLDPSQRSLKLIDYAFMEKPVLSYTNDEQSDRAFRQFLHGNYSEAFILENVDQFRVENVCTEFLKLVDVG